MPRQFLLIITTVLCCISATAGSVDKPGLRAQCAAAFLEINLTEMYGYYEAPLSLSSLPQLNLESSAEHEISRAIFNNRKSFANAIRARDARKHLQPFVNFNEAITPHLASTLTLLVPKFQIHTLPVGVSGDAPEAGLELAPLLVRVNPELYIGISQLNELDRLTAFPALRPVTPFRFFAFTELPLPVQGVTLFSAYVRDPISAALKQDLFEAFEAAAFELVQNLPNGQFSTPVSTSGPSLLVNTSVLTEQHTLRFVESLSRHSHEITSGLRPTRRRGI
jgi:hypothetical protein